MKTKTFIQYKDERISISLVVCCGGITQKSAIRLGGAYVTSP